MPCSSAECLNYSGHTLYRQTEVDAVSTQQKQQPFYGSLSRTTQGSRYQKKRSPTHTYPDHQLSFISFLHPLQSIASPMFNVHA